VGLETAFAVMYTELVSKGVITLEKLVDLMCIHPRARFGITADAGYTVFEVETPYTIDPETFATMGRSTPFAGMTVCGKHVLTAVGDKLYMR
ncbi:MAG: dihydroorotase, partial [Clostridia bacterium]|nr:dihydroorotase [Clostridia bacterium]